MLAHFSLYLAFQTSLFFHREFAHRLKNTKFDLAITSDLKRAMQTAEAIQKKNNSIDELVCWKIVRERCLGDFEGVHEHYIALRDSLHITSSLICVWAPCISQGYGAGLNFRFFHMLKIIPLCYFRSNQMTLTHMQYGEFWAFISTLGHSKASPRPLGLILIMGEGLNFRFLIC